jgi:cytochrome c1
MLANTPDNLELWVRHPTKINEKTLMPDVGVTTRDATDIAAYLYSLK